MMWSFTYPAKLHAEAGGHLTVRFADLPEAITSGNGRQEAVRQAADCLEEAIAGRIADSLDIPPPSKAKRGQTQITLSGSMAAKASLYLAMREAGITRVLLARRLGVDEKEVRRMLNPRHPTKLPRIEQALASLGKRLVVSLETEAA
jgi:antitoxin HicB